MHFKRIFFQKGRKNVKSVWSFVHSDKGFIRVQEIGYC